MIANFRLFILSIIFSCSACDKDTPRSTNLLELIWEAPLQRDLYSFTRPGVAGSTVVLGTVNGQLHGFSIHDGTLKWQTSIGSSELAVNSIVAYGTMVFYDYFRETLCLNAETGAILWRYHKPHYSSLSNPAVTGNFVFTGDGKVTIPGEVSDGYVYCLNQSNGSLVWETRIGERVYAIQPRVSEDRVYVATRDWDFVKGGDFGALYCLIMSTGQILWQFDVTADSLGRFRGGGTEGTPAILENHVFLTTKYGSILCLDRNTGQLIWQNNAEHGFFGGVTIDSSTLRGYAIANVVYICFNPMSGSILWQTTAPHYGTSVYEPFVLGKYLYSWEIGGLRAVDKQSGREVLEMLIDDPIEAYGRFAFTSDAFFSHSDRRLFAFRPIGE